MSEARSPWLALFENELAEAVTQQDNKQTLTIDMDKPVLVPLTHIAPMLVSGADAEKFLQGQISTHMKELKDEYRLGACATPKGRMVTSFTIVQPQDQVNLMIMDLPLVEETVSHLKKYSVFFRKAQMESGLDQWLGMGLIGAKDQLAETLQSIGLELPDQEFSITRQEGKVAFSRPLTLDSNSTTVSNENLVRIELWCLADQAVQLFKNLLDHSTLKDVSVWQGLDVLANLPAVSQATKELWIPQMLNLDKLHGVSFSKGCYTGQEIIARMQYLGKSKRGTYVLELNNERDISTASEIKPGTPVHSSAKNSSVGEVVQITPHPFDPKRVILLAVLEHEKLESDLTVGEEGNRLILLDQPYQVLVTEEEGSQGPIKT